MQTKHEVGNKNLCEGEKKKHRKNVVLTFVIINFVVLLLLLGQQCLTTFAEEKKKFWADNSLPKIKQVLLKLKETKLLLGILTANSKEKRLKVCLNLNVFKEEI